MRQSDTEEKLKQLVRLFDRDGDEFLTRQEPRTLLIHFGQMASGQVIRAMIAEEIVTEKLDSLTSRRWHSESK
jgi:Ca2+-binding EF-hand superfamily protein